METTDKLASTSTETDAGGEFPKIIWILWFQGFQNAPHLVQECVASWQRHNPGWQVILLDEKNVKDHVQVDDIIRHHRESITPQAHANVIRTNLLATYGGVWADATLFCCRPLDEWIHPHLVAGFFAFEKPGPDRLISNWFLASRKNCHLIVQYAKIVNQYWTANRFPYQKNPIVRKFIRSLGRLLNGNPRRAALWVHPLTARLLRLHPYHWHHYLFCRLIHTDERSARLWSRTPKLSADIPHRLLDTGLLKPVTPGIKAMIQDRQEPLYKLNWRVDEQTVPGCTLDYLLHNSMPPHAPAREQPVIS